MIIEIEFKTKENTQEIPNVDVKRQYDNKNDISKKYKKEIIKSLDIKNPHLIELISICSELIKNENVFIFLNDGKRSEDIFQEKIQIKNNKDFYYYINLILSNTRLKVSESFYPVGFKFENRKDSFYYNNSLIGAFDIFADCINFTDLIYCYGKDIDMKKISYLENVAIYGGISYNIFDTYSKKIEKKKKK